MEPRRSTVPPVIAPTVWHVFTQSSRSVIASLYFLRNASLDVVVEVRVLTATVHLDDELIGRPQARVRFERLLGLVMSKPLIVWSRSPFSIPRRREACPGERQRGGIPTILPFSCSGTMRACRMRSAWFSRILSTTPRSILNSVALTF